MIFKKRKTGPAPDNEPKTRIDPFPGSSSKRSKNNEASASLSEIETNEEPQTRDAVFDAPVLALPTADDPKVGILVIIEGPGRGFSGSLSYGENSIGRGSGMDIRLDFGDADLSEKEHARISYDMESRNFHISPGSDGSELMVGKQIVDKKPRKLKDRDRIMMGNTVLLFVAICGPAFDWRADVSGTKD